MFPKIVGFPPKSSILNRVFHYKVYPFWGPTPILGNTHIPSNQPLGGFPHLRRGLLSLLGTSSTLRGDFHQASLGEARGIRGGHRGAWRIIPGFL